MTTLFFRDKKVRLEFIRVNQGDSLFPDRPYAQIRDLNTGTIISTCMHGFELQHAIVWKNCCYVFGTDYYGIWMIRSFDLHTWSVPQLVFNSENSTEIHYQNNTIIHNGEYFVMGLDLLGGPYNFTVCFARSYDLQEWHYIPGAIYKPHFYTSCPHLIYRDGWYYLFHLRMIDGGYHTCVARSQDLLVWEDSPHNPILSPAPDDIMKNKNPSETKQYKVTNASDLYLWEENGKTYGDYNLSDQQGYPPDRGPIPYLRQAVYDGSMSELLEKLFS